MYPPSRRRISAQEGLASTLRRRCERREEQLLDAQKRTARLAEELATTRKQLEQASPLAKRSP